MSKQVTPWKGWHENSDIEDLEVWGFWLHGQLRGEVTRTGEHSWLAQVLMPSGEAVTERFLPSQVTAKAFVTDYYTDPVDFIIEDR